MPDASASTQGLSQPATDGVEYGQVSLNNNSPQSVFGTGERTTSILIVALPANGSQVFVGFDSDVDQNSGIPLEAGDSFGMDLDVAEQEVFVMTNSPTQTVAVMSVG